MKYDQETKGKISVVLREADNRLNNTASTASVAEITHNLTRAAEILILLNDYKKLGCEIIERVSSNQKANIEEYAAHIHSQLKQKITSLGVGDNL